MTRSFIDNEVAAAIQTVSERFPEFANVLTDISRMTEDEYDEANEEVDWDTETFGVTVWNNDGDHTIVVSDNFIEKHGTSSELLAYSIGYVAWVIQHNLFLKEGHDKEGHLWVWAANIRYEIEYGGHPDFGYCVRKYWNNYRALVGFEEAPMLTMEEIYNRLVEVYKDD